MSQHDDESKNGAEAGSIKLAPVGMSRESTSPARMIGYVSMVLGAGVAGTSADAAVIAIDFSAVSGINGGLAPGAFASVPILDGNGNALVGPTIKVLNNVSYNYNIYHGLVPDGYAVSLANYGYVASPFTVAAGTSVDSLLFGSASLVQTGQINFGLSVLRFNTTTAPDIVNGFIPFAFGVLNGANPYFGYVQVNWTSASDQFEILCGAFEDNAGTAITVTDCRVAGVPEPNGLALLALGAAGLGLARQFRRRKFAQA